MSKGGEADRNGATAVYDAFRSSFRQMKEEVERELPHSLNEKECCEFDILVLFLTLDVFVQTKQSDITKVNIINLAMGHMNKIYGTRCSTARERVEGYRQAVSGECYTGGIIVAAWKYCEHQLAVDWNGAVFSENALARFLKQIHYTAFLYYILPALHETAIKAATGRDLRITGQDEVSKAIHKIWETTGAQKEEGRRAFLDGEMSQIKAKLASLLNDSSGCQPHGQL